MGQWFTRVWWRGWLLGVGAFLFFLPRLSLADLKVSEEDVILLVLHQNLEVLASSFDPKIAATLITEVESRFDILLGGRVRYNLDRSDKQSIVFGTDNRQILYEAEAKKKFPFGMETRAFFSNQHDRTNSAFATDPRFFESRLGFEVKAPFLKNRFGKSDKGDVDFAASQQKATQQSSLAQLDEQVYEALNLYWRLVASHYYVGLAKRFLTKAQEFFQVTQEKKQIGLSEDPDVLAAKALVEERQLEILRAENFVEDFEERLRNRLNLGLTDKIIPTDKLYTKGKIPSKAEIYETALLNRNDYQALLQEAKSKDIRIAVAKDQKLPSLDLFTSLELNSVDPNYGTVLGQTFSAQNPNWFIGAQFDLSFENRLAKSALEKSKLEKARLLVDLKALENDIATSIFEALRELQLQRQETLRYGKIADLQNRKLAIEEKNYLQGRSSSDIIVRFQTDWLEAEREQLDSELREKLADVDLRRIMSILVSEKLKKMPGEAR